MNERVEAPTDAQLGYIASPKQWAAIRAEKGSACRFAATLICDGPVHMHHLVARSALGDDVGNNLVPLCQIHHGLVTQRVPPMLKLLAESLTSAEYAYVFGKMGEGAMGRLFGV